MCRSVPQLKVYKDVAQPFQSNSWTAVSSEISSIRNDHDSRRFATPLLPGVCYASVGR